MQYLDTASVVLGALAGMADTPAAPLLPRGSYFTEALIREILRTSAFRRSKKFIYAILHSPGPIAWSLTRLTPSTYSGEWPVLVYFFPPPRHITISVAPVMGRNDASKEERTSVVEERFSRGWILRSNSVREAGEETPGYGRYPGEWTRLPYSLILAHYGSPLP